jgi:RNA polymerase subunit RPABC4/transcription elongation factor Spt4
MNTGFRTYLHRRVNGIETRILGTWAQRRCVKCQRFLSKHQQKYCSFCSDKIVKEQRRETALNWENNNRERHNKNQREEYRLRVKSNAQKMY